MALAERPLPLRVELRPAQPADAPMLKSWREEATVRRYQPLGDATTAQLRSDLSQQSPADLRRGRGQKFQWIILADARPAGWITLVVANWEHGLAEVGYALSTSYQHRGVMPNALTQLLAELFLNSPLERIEARCAVENRASQRVLEKVGFQREGLLRGYFVLGGQRVDNQLYGILREDFLGLQRQGEPLDK